MKKLSKLMCLLLAVGMLMGIASCSSDAGEGGGGSSGGTETVRISCGPLNGYQNVLYNSIADMMNKANPGKYSFAIEASTGSAENARLLAMDETDFGTMGMDMTLSCYNAEGEFEGLPAEQIMHVATHSGNAFVFDTGIVLFSRMNCFRRTNICTSTTLCASLRVDMIDITFRDSANRTLVDTSSASNTIVTNYVSHFLLDLNYY